MSGKLPGGGRCNSPFDIERFLGNTGQTNRRSQTRPRQNGQKSKSDNSQSQHVCRHFMIEHKYNVLFLCTGNSARSILAEAILSRDGAGRFHALSAGSQPKGSVHPYAIELLQRLNFRIDDFRSKSWGEFAGESAPKMDFVFTVCDSAAAGVCPVWPGQPMSAHWGIPDPAAVEGTEAERRLAFIHAYASAPCWRIWRPSGFGLSSSVSRPRSGWRPAR